MLDHEIMRALPDAAKGDDYASTPEIHRRLRGYMMNPPVVKTVQRRLEKLFDDELVESERRGNALVWRKRAGAGGLGSKRSGMMSHDEALALQVLRRFSSRQIPSLVAESLSPMFDMAEKRLAAVQSEGERRYRNWSEKVEVESGAFALKHPSIDSDLFATVSRALFYEQKLQVVYRPRTKTDNSEAKVINPLGLVEVGGLVYLVAGMAHHPKPAIYRLDRLATATILAEAYVYPRAFKLSDYVRGQRQFDFLVEGQASIKLRFTNGAGDHLIESPLSDDQKITHTATHLEVQGTVLVSQRLRWWLRSFGPNVEVLAPASLRAEMEKEARQLAALYGNDGA
ncbi:helix-turn-helix transcriptional regulator [Achromobacter aloeverae]|uniref:WYL domain-containing protein n=1 Tax=Achromobacter aloeverae TaxID=1750518 RepID=A0A4Q1HGV0_9BURK|nr:WYL domain-containing protein [Achromobacter aloeverae]RXN86730.1 WYL domain-containing protein [Achromobacter aloeverae]